jgi:hypothetical protein
MPAGVSGPPAMYFLHEKLTFYMKTPFMQFDLRSIEHAYLTDTHHRAHRYK